jgi:hypothetical protein
MKHNAATIGASNNKMKHNAASNQAPLISLSGPGNNSAYGNIQQEIITN